MGQLILNRTLCRLRQCVLLPCALSLLCGTIGCRRITKHFKHGQSALTAQQCVRQASPARISSLPDPLHFRFDEAYLPKGVLWPTREQLEYWRGKRFDPNTWQGEVRALGEPTEEGFAMTLRKMREPSLFSRAMSGQEAYRFIWIRSFHPPLAVRIVRAPAGILLAVRETEGTGQYPSGADADLQIRELSPAQWHCLKALLVATRFWDMPSTDKSGGLDGAEWIVEGIHNGKYHIVERWSPYPDDPFRALSWYFMQLVVGHKDIGQSGY